MKLIDQSELKDSWYFPDNTSCIGLSDCLKILRGVNKWLLKEVICQSTYLFVTKTEVTFSYEQNNSENHTFFH